MAAAEAAEAPTRQSLRDRAEAELEAARQRLADAEAAAAATAASRAAADAASRCGSPTHERPPLQDAQDVHTLRLIPACRLASFRLLALGQARVTDGQGLMATAEWTLQGGWRGAGGGAAGAAGRRGYIWRRTKGSARRAGERGRRPCGGGPGRRLVAAAWLQRADGSGFGAPGGVEAEQPQRLGRSGMRIHPNPAIGRRKLVVLCKD